MFVNTSAAQALAFASKVATAMVIPQVASFISLYSTRKAIQIAFFSSISNCVSVFLDTRAWQHSRNIPKFRTRVSGISWLVILLSILLYGVIVASDLLVFQLARRRTDWKAHRDDGFNLTFQTTTAPITEDFSVNVPLALTDSNESITAFKNKTYVPAERYEYFNFTPDRSKTLSAEGVKYEILYDVPRVKAPNKLAPNNSFICLCGQQVETTQVANGLPLVSLNCFNDDSQESAPYYPSIGFNKQSNLLAYQGDDGAHFSLMTSKQRDKQRINETGELPTTTRLFLDTSTENFTLISVQLNGTSADLDVDAAFDYLKQWRNGTTNYPMILTYYQIQEGLAYGTIPTYTYNYLIFEIIGLAGNQSLADYYAVPGLIYFNYISYSSQNIFVPGKEIKSEYLGIDANNTFGPRTTSILTDLSPEHIIIAMLANPQRPIQYSAVEMVDAWPAVILIIASGGLSLLLFIYRLAHQVGFSSRIPFDPHLELFHSAVNDMRSRSVDSLLVKMQDTDLVMVNGYCPDIDGNKIGLMPKYTNMLPLADEKLFR